MKNLQRLMLNLSSNYTLLTWRDKMEELKLELLTQIGNDGVKGFIYAEFTKHDLTRVMHEWVAKNHPDMNLLTVKVESITL